MSSIRPVANLNGWITNILILTHISLAIAVFVGGRDRFSLPSYEPLVHYTGGHVWVWGIWIALSAVLIIIPTKRFRIAGFWIGMMWHIVWMSCFMIAATNYDTAAATPIPMYGCLAVVNAAMLTARVIDKT